MSSNERPHKITVAIGRALPEGAAPSSPATPPEPRVQTPLIDIHEGPEGLILEADLPGATEESVNIQLEENVLHLRAEIGGCGPGDRPIHEEFPIPGVYQRSFILSDEVDRANIGAELRQGVLRLVLPKGERPRSRRIEIRNP